MRYSEQALVMCFKLLECDCVSLVHAASGTTHDRGHAKKFNLRAFVTCVVPNKCCSMQVATIQIYKIVLVFKEILTKFHLSAMVYSQVTMFISI